MSATPTVHRSVHPAVTIRRAQSERRYLSPWQVQVSWPPTPMQPPLLQPELCRGSTWTWVDHHHAPRTAFIPPANAHQTRMIGQSQTVFSDGGSVRPRPILPCAQLPPLALGSPPMLAPLTLEERLAQDRMTAFLAGETLPHRPRSILSCPESPLYESLLSCLNESEDTITLAETEGEHEYQQIQVVNGAAKADKQEHWKKTDGDSRDRGLSAHVPSEAAPESPERHSHKTPLTKLNTLDVKPEKYGKENEAADDTSFSYQSRKDVLEASSSAKIRRNSTQSVSSHDSQRSAVYTASSSSGDNISIMSDSDTTYQVLSQPSTVIYVSNGGNRNPTGAESPHAPESNGKKHSSENSRKVSGNNTHHVGTQVSQSSSSNSSKSSHKSIQPFSRSGSADAATQVEMTEITQPPKTFFPPLTIELPETKSTGWKYEQNAPTKKPTQARRGESPYIITTLDPPIKRTNQRHHKNSASSPDPRPADIPPLIVNFDSEDTFSDDDTVYEMHSCWSPVGGSTSLYMADSDTSSLYSSVGEIYTMFVTEPDALVYVYKPPPRTRGHGPHRSSTLSYRFPTYAVSRGIGSSGGSSESESSWGSGTVSFVEPSYRPSNLSVGSRGHLKIDYSCSWNRLDYFVKTGSSNDGCCGCSDDYRQHYGSRSPRDHSASACMTAPAALLSPWERYSDTAAG